ncbi:MAG: ATP-dependent DNA helicase [Clostridia bacterium]
MEQKKINLSVKDLVDFTTGAGNIEKKSISILSEAAWEGTQCHTRLQKEMSSLHPEDFSKEIYVSDKVENPDILLTVSGRIDGILKKDGQVTIYELKTTVKTLDDIMPEDHPAHWGQAECYGYIYGKNNGLEGLAVKLIYINRETQERREFEKTFSMEALTKIYNGFVLPYLNWMTKIRKWEILRNNSIRTMTFPFANYREGQRELARQAYLSIKESSNIFIQAPTGIGKTIGTLFPAVKAMGEGLVHRIFYLTAKTVTANIAIDTYKIMCDRGLNLRALVITAKDKVCPYETRDCDPQNCERANGYYDRAKDALKELLSDPFMERERIRECADKHNICPFELSLDASQYSDLIICDYNYLFDPRIKLQRFFNEVSEEYCFLIDEAHNLVDRGREMYSARINQRDVAELRKQTGIEWDDLRRRLGKINAELNRCKAEMFEGLGEGQVSQRHLPEKLLEQVKKCAFVMDKYMDYEKEGEYGELFLDVFFKMLYFTKVAEFYDSRYATFYVLENDRLEIKLMCLDPSYLLSKNMDLGRSAVLFSATLEPMEYYKATLGARTKDRILSLPSPFPGENLKVIIEGRISTKYRDRDLSYDDIALLVKEVVETKRGNYMVYFPSYKYMEDVLGAFLEGDVMADVLVQKSKMTEEDREKFLNRFNRYGETTLVGFAVMGGIFGEGIDLAGDKLNGVIVVGTGLPMVCPERELIRQYFDENEMDGFDYAYTFPGINRVLQASGRVIRTELDRGFVILIDSRFAGFRYKKLFPGWWRPEYFTYVDKKIAASVSTFYGT